MKVLIVEDQVDFANVIAEYLSGLGYSCESVHNYAQANEKISLYRYDCILLDVMLPDGDGLEVLSHLIRLNVQDGVIVISAKDSIEDKVKGLNLGADDYLAKPFNLSELAARLFSVIRRKQYDNSNQIIFDQVKIDLLSKQVLVGDIEVFLTKKEFDLLIFFLGNKNRVISKNALAERLSGDMADLFDSHDFVYAHIKNLKKKMYDAGCKKYLKTMYGIGYKWEA